MVQVPETSRYNFIRLVVSLFQALNHIFSESHIDITAFGWKIAVSFLRTWKVSSYDMEGQSAQWVQDPVLSKPLVTGTWTGALSMPTKLPLFHILPGEPSSYMVWRQSERTGLRGASGSKSWWLGDYLKKYWEIWQFVNCHYRNVLMKISPRKNFWKCLWVRAWDEGRQLE